MTAVLPGCVINIILLDGNPSGIRLIDNPLWTAYALAFPRASFAQAKNRKELTRAGVYILIGPSEDSELPCVYIGQGGTIQNRLEIHNINKDFWTSAIVFVSRENWLNAAHTQYLEARLVQLAREARRAKLDNQVNPNVQELSEADKMIADGFLMNTLSLLPVLGVSVFEPAPTTNDNRNILHLRGNKVDAKGYDSPQGFVVYRGSQAVPKEVAQANAALIRYRQELVTEGVLASEGDRLVFTQDYVFTSSSKAAAVALGRQANGRIEWKDDSGRTLKEIQEAQSED